ncbi:phosphoribosyltransferase [Candidatus Geothermarchaeota archaeon]|nr:MAG: phosphoribosyltransferase [Candidatus Geothermarchaeota archaeon]
MFKDRFEAGRKLAERLKEYEKDNVLILAIPRGGVIIGYEVSKTIKAPLDLIIPRKLSAPGNPELAIGAVGPDGSMVLNKDIIKWLGVSTKYIEAEKERQMREVKRRMLRYRGSESLPEVKDKVVILVDDGIATGATMRAAIASVRKMGAKKIVVAVPVGPPETIKRLRKEADEVICLETPEPFFAIGQFYLDFEQVSDEEVIRFLKETKED